MWTNSQNTVCEAAGIEIPNVAGIDGISFWPQVLGARGEPRKAIYTWYNGNSPVTDQSKTLRYAFTRDFKRYAPHANYPEGRFFDLRSDPLEKAGDRKVKVAWVHYHSSGLDISRLDTEQCAAYKQLGRVLAAHAHVPVTELTIEVSVHRVTVGQAMALQCEIQPARATRRNVIWESSHPEIAPVDKFGRLIGHRPGKIRITVYSWDDAFPTAARLDPTYARGGISDTVEIVVEGDDSQ